MGQPELCTTTYVYDLTCCLEEPRYIHYLVRCSWGWMTCRHLRPTNFDNVVLGTILSWVAKVLLLIYWSYT